VAKVMHPRQLAPTIVLIVKHFKLKKQNNRIIRYTSASGYWHSIINLVKHKVYN